MYVATFDKQRELNQQLANFPGRVEELSSGSWGDLPSLLNIFSIVHVAHAWNLINITYMNKDHEGVTLSIMGFTKRIFGWCGAVPNAIQYGNRIWNYLTPNILHPVAQLSSIFALVHCAIEGTSEALGRITDHLRV